MNSAEKNVTPHKISNDDGVTIINIKKKRYHDDIEASDPITVLTEASRNEQGGDVQRTSNLLRQFGNEYLHILDECYHIDCVVELMKIGFKSRAASIRYLSLQYVHYIFEKSPLKPGLWEAIKPFFHLDGRFEENFQFNSSDPSLILNLFKLALYNGLLSLESTKKVLLITRKCISSDDQTNRVAAVNFFVALINSVGPKTNSLEQKCLERLLCEMASDRDCRVRLAAMKGLLAISESSHSLSPDVYSLIKQLCCNSSRPVRIEALKILKNMAHRYPEVNVKGRNNATLRLIDDAFAAVCEAVHDMEVAVRTEAARLLGDFKNVSDSFLDQTLDKKLLNSMQISKLKFGVTRGARMGAGRSEKSRDSQWFLGKKLGEDIPVEKNEEEQLSVISTGACGAFVSALEDEFMVVRTAGVYSLGKLAANRPLFAAIAIDHLADMFNDEIEQVRLDALYALTPLIVHGVLEKEQLDAMLTVLDDALPDSREALRKLLGKSTLSTRICLRLCLNALLKCMKRFPIDRSSIHLCLSELGRKHPAFVQSMIFELLEIHPLFEISGPPLEDQVYLAKLIMILNAASVYKPLCSLIPNFALRHYEYLRCSMRDLIPEIAAFSNPEVDCFKPHVPVTDKDDVDKQISMFLRKCYEMMLETSEAKSFEQKDVLRNFISRDLNSLCETSEKTANSARFLAILLDCLTKYDRLLQMIMYNDSDVLLKLVDKILSSLDCAESSFCNVDAILLSLLAECSLRLRYLKLAIQSRGALIDSALTSRCFLIETEVYERRIKEFNLTSSANMVKILAKVREFVEMGHEKKAVNTHFIFNLMHTSPVTLPKTFSSLGHIAVKWVEIVEPSEPLTEAIRFIAGLPMGIAVNILLHNFHKSDITKFRIKVEYPDQKFTLFKPRQNDFTKITPEKIRLLSKVLIHGEPWSTSAEIHLRCVFYLPNNLPDFSVKGSESSECRLVSIPDSPHFANFASINVPIYPFSNKTW